MSIYIKAEYEKIVQVNDKTRIDLSKSFSSDSPIAKYEICLDMEAEEPIYLDITENKFYDLCFESEKEDAENSGYEYEIGIRLTGSEETNPEEKESSIFIKVYSEENDKLLSNDSDLIPYENDISNFVREGRNSFIDVHREVRNMIVKWFDEMGHKNKYDNEKLTIDNFQDKTELNNWSKFMVLQLIFESQSNQVEDIFSVKSKKYQALKDTAKQRCQVSLDYDLDGEKDSVAKILTTRLKRV